jgi:hypothetical protein
MNRIAERGPDVYEARQSLVTGQSLIRGRRAGNRRGNETGNQEHTGKAEATEKVLNLHNWRAHEPYCL